MSDVYQLKMCYGLMYKIEKEKKLGKNCNVFTTENDYDK